MRCARTHGAGSRQIRTGIDLYSGTILPEEGKTQFALIFGLFDLPFKSESEQNEEGLDWASDGRMAEKTAGERSKLKEAHRIGQGAQSLALHMCNRLNFH